MWTLTPSSVLLIWKTDVRQQHTNQWRHMSDPVTWHRQCWKREDTSQWPLTFEFFTYLVHRYFQGSHECFHDPKCTSETAFYWSTTFSLLIVSFMDLSTHFRSFADPHHLKRPVLLYADTRFHFRHCVFSRWKSKIRKTLRDAGLHCGCDEEKTNVLSLFSRLYDPT